MLLLRWKQLYCLQLTQVPSQQHQVVYYLLVVDSLSVEDLYRRKNPSSFYFTFTRTIKLNLLLYGLSVLFHPRLSNRIRYMSCVYIHSMRTPPTEGNSLDNFNRKNLFAHVHNSTNLVSQTSFPHASEMTLNSTESLEITVLRSKLRASYTPTPTKTLTAVTAMLC